MNCSGTGEGIDIQAVKSQILKGHSAVRRASMAQFGQVPDTAVDFGNIDGHVDNEGDKGGILQDWLTAMSDSATEASSSSSVKSTSDVDGVQFTDDDDFESNINVKIISRAKKKPRKTKLMKTVETCMKGCKHL